MENNEQSNQAPVVEDNGGPVRGHLEFKPLVVGIKEPDIAEELNALRARQTPTFEQALEVVKARMRDELAKLEARDDASLSNISLSVWAVKDRKPMWVARANLSATIHGEKEEFETLDEALANVPRILTREEKALNEIKTLRAEIAAKQSELERLEGRAQ